MFKALCITTIKKNDFSIQMKITDTIVNSSEILMFEETKSNLRKQNLDLQFNKLFKLTSQVNIYIFFKNNLLCLLN